MKDKTLCPVKGCFNPRQPSTNELTEINTLCAMHNIASLEGIRKTVAAASQTGEGTEAYCKRVHHE